MLLGILGTATVHSVSEQAKFNRLSSSNPDFSTICLGHELKSAVYTSRYISYPNKTVYDII